MPQNNQQKCQNYTARFLNVYSNNNLNFYLFLKRTELR